MEASDAGDPSSLLDSDANVSRKLVMATWATWPRHGAVEASTFQLDTESILEMKNYVTWRCAKTLYKKSRHPHRMVR